MIVEVWLDSSSSPCIYLNAKTVFTKGGLLCVTDGELSIKFPLCRVHKVVHPYNSIDKGDEE